MAWAERSGRRRPSSPSHGVLRFAFYGRVSTADSQDPLTSRRGSDQAAALAAGHGVIVAEFFDVGESRTLPWTRRPQAAAWCPAQYPEPAVERPADAAAAEMVISCHRPPAA